MAKATKKKSSNSSKSAKAPAKKSPSKPVPKTAGKPAPKAPPKPAPKAPSKAPPKEAPAAPVAPVPTGDVRRHVLSLSFLRDGDEFLARLETDAGQITEMKNRSLDQLLSLVAGELEDLLE
jgi:hypothetical protein